MTIKVYVNYYNAEVITEKEFFAKVEELAKEFDEDEGEFEIFLDENYTTMELWNMTENEKAETTNAFHKKNVERATDDIKSEWIERTLEI